MMVDNVMPLIDKLKIKFDEIKGEMSEEDFSKLMQWCVDEYSNFMVISKDNFSDTIKLCLSLDIPPSEKKLFKVLADAIEEYGSTQAFFRVSRGYLAV